MTGGRRVPAAELAQAVSDYPGSLSMPPEEAWDRLDVIQVQEAVVPTFSVRFDLWADGEPSDLSVLATLVEVSPGTFSIELDDVRVF